MKKIAILATIIVLIAVACKAKKSAGTASGNDTSMEKQLTAVKARFPDATKEELERGSSVYSGACTKCHGKKAITGYTEEKLLNIVDVMSKKASLTADEKQALIRFAVGVRATKQS